MYVPKETLKTAFRQSRPTFQDSKYRYHRDQEYLPLRYYFMVLYAWM